MINSIPLNFLFFDADDLLSECAVFLTLVDGGFEDNFGKSVNSDLMVFRVNEMVFEYHTIIDICRR